MDHFVIAVIYSIICVLTRVFTQVKFNGRRSVSDFDCAVGDIVLCSVAGWSVVVMAFDGWSDTGKDGC